MKNSSDEHSKREIRGLWLGLLGVVIFALTLPMTRIVVQELHPLLNGLGHLDALDAHFGAERVLGGQCHIAATLDEALLPFLDRTVEEVDPIERAVLRIAAYELIHRIDVPYRVVLNEAIETAKRFGSEHGHTYINGVLDHAAVEWRPAEAQARR